VASPKAVRTIGPLDRPLPSAIQSEQIVLASVLLEPSCWDTVAAVLSPEDFSTERSRRVFARMKDLADRGEKCDYGAIFNELVKHGQQEPDSLAYLSGLTRDYPSVVNLDHHLREVKDKSELRNQIRIAHSVIERCYTGAEPAQVIAESAAQTFGKIDSSRSDEGSTPEEIIRNSRGGISVFLDPTLRKSGRPTGFKKLDEYLGGGLQDGELIVLAARPSCGKSAMMSNICQNIILDPREPRRVDIFSLEMSAAALVTRMMCAAARIDAHKFRCGYLSQEERQRLQQGLNLIVESPLRIHENFRKTLPEIMRRIRKAFKDGSALVAIDFIQLMVTGSKSENRNLEIEEIGRALKLATLECDKPILVLSQIGRSAERRGGDMRPQLSDLKSSGSIEEHADTVLSIFREELYKKDREDLRGLADLDILKQRNGPLTRVPLRFLGQYVKFESAIQEMDDEGSRGSSYADR